jgi:type I restriction enzyme R subunit
VENESIQAEAMANTSADFHSSPTISAELETAIYASGIGHNAGIKALLQMGNLEPLVNVLIAMGLYEKSRVAAVGVAAG